MRPTIKMKRVILALACTAMMSVVALNTISIAPVAEAPCRAAEHCWKFPAVRRPVWSDGMDRSAPLTAKQLKGKVVLVDFSGTNSCINCIRAIPYVRAWAEKYKDDGLVVIGVHAAGV